MTEMIERRRSPRTVVQTEEVVRLELRHRVQLLDISQSGALIAGDPGLPIGTSARVRAGLAALPFSAEVSVRRHHARRAPRGQVGMGTLFNSMDDRSRQSLDQFLRKGKD